MAPVRPAPAGLASTTMLALVLCAGTSTAAPSVPSGTAHFVSGTTTARSASGERSRLRGAEGRRPAFTPAPQRPAVEAPSLGDQLSWLREQSGLTWDQVARMVGVSRRAVHHWLSGGRPSAGHLERVGDLVRVVQQVGGRTPDERRQLLFAVDRDGRSTFDRLLEQRALGSERISDPGFRPEALLGALHDGERS